MRIYKILTKFIKYGIVKRTSVVHCRYTSEKRYEETDGLRQ